MKERGIIFSAPMVKAILAGRKTQTRRIVKTPEKYNACTYGQPGDRLWVRESYCIELPPDFRYDAEGLAPKDYPAYLQKESIIHYKATTELKSIGKWRPSIHMPRWAARIWLEITEVRVERLTSIQPGDVLAEGIPRRTEDCAEELGVFRDLWDSIYGEGAWEQNPWVWVIEFKKVNP